MMPIHSPLKHIKTMAKINGSSFALQYKRTTSRPIDSTDVWDTIEDAHIYARNTDTEAYVPYAGQVISVLENGAIYKLVKDDSIPETDGKKHFKLAMIGSNNDNDDRYLRKDTEDTAGKLIHFLEGIDAKGVSTLEEINLLRDIVSKNFANGSTGFGIYQDESGNYHLDIDFVNIRRKLTVDEIQVQQSSYIGGRQWNTAAGIICNRVEDKGTAWRCYFRTTDAEGRVVRNTFAVGDQAICETFNLDRQAGGTAGNHYYWRLVTGRGDDYIDLSKTDCDAGSDAPQAGNNIVQLGNRTDASRQGAICWDSVTDGGPYVRVYKGISSYHLPEPRIDLNPEKSTIKAKLVSEATGKDVDETFKSLQADMDLVREQADREYTIWFFDHVPAPENLPASEWATLELKRLHDQDLFYNKSTGLCYRYEKNADGSYSWNGVTDQFTVKALENAAKAQDTADGKRRVFVSQPAADSVYDVGDLWVNATYSGGGTSYKNDSLVCITAKKKGMSFSISHWKPTSTATTAVIQNLGDRITQVVSDLGDTDAAVSAAERLASQGISDAYDAYRKAQEALGIAQDADSAAYVNSTVIQQTKDSIAALANRISFDSSGNISNIKTSGLVTTADFAALTGKEIVYDKNGHVDMTKTAGVVTTANFAQIFSERATADGYVKRAEISTFITEDEAGRLISNVTIQADKINFLGKTVINGKFVVDMEGNVTMNNATVNGKVTATEGKIGGLSIDSGMLKWKSYDYFGGDSRQLQLGASSSDYDGMVDVKFNAATTGKFGVKAIGANVGGAAIYGSTGDMLYPASSMTFAGFFVGPMDVRDTGYGISSDVCASKSFRVITSRNSNGTYTYHEGVNWNRTVGSPDLDSIRLIVEGGIITGYYKE